MLDKGDHDISKDERTMANEPIPIKSIFEPNICLTKVGWLHVCEHHILLVGQKLCHNPTDGLESYLMHRHRVDGDDGQVLILSSRAHQYHPLHWLPSSNLLMIQSPRNERLWVSTLA